ncbi:hypothetical protein [Campylobacter sp. RM16187]|uniref:hypothetical protein n=1 Tax=Campylobacter sp. RM16187 TaxID=1660063 RepID=UPI0021B69D20|nr:hypothetical protein [Campylobacter sp. RM16187]QKG29272.1 hypothetical protein CDOMF_1012 [Campylobacter sp. RM16187]
MILTYEFEYANSNENLAFFLNFYAKKSKLSYGIEREGSFIRLHLEGEQEELLKFSDEISALIPHFIFLSNSKVFVSEELKGEQKEFKNTLSNITPSIIQDFHEGKISACENGVFSDVKLFKDDKFEAVIKENFTEFLEFALLSFKNGENFKFKDLEGSFEILNFDELNSDFDLVMPTKLKNLPKIFICDQNSQIALASYEKPMIELKTNALYRQNHPSAPHFFNVKAPRDIFIYAFCEKLFEAGVNFIALKSGKELFKATVLENEYIFSNAQIYYKDGFSDFIEVSKDKNLANFYLSADELGIKDENKLRVFLSKFDEDEFKIYLKNSDFEVLNLQIPSSFEEIFEMISKEEGGDRLVANFSANFSLASGSINTPNSFFSLFCIVGKIFGFDDDLKRAGTKLLENAMDFNGPKGPRLDFKMASKTGFDIVKFIRSGMSFRLAGVDDKILSFGYLESFAHFISDFCDVLREDFEFKHIVLQGSLFECKALSNLIAKHVRVGTSAKFSKGLSLEEMREI